MDRTEFIKTMIFVPLALSGLAKACEGGVDLSIWEISRRKEIRPDLCGCVDHYLYLRHKKTGRSWYSYYMLDEDGSYGDIEELRKVEKTLLRRTTKENLNG